MAFVMKRTNGLRPEEITNAVYAAAAAEGATVKDPRAHLDKANPGRQESSRVVPIIGILEYNGSSYEIGVSYEIFEKGSVKAVVENEGKKTEVESNGSFNCLETSVVNGILFFAKKQKIGGLSDIAEDINFEPSGATLDFLRRVGQRLRNGLGKNVEAMALTYVPSRNTPRVYEKIQ